MFVNWNNVVLICDFVFEMQTCNPVENRLLIYVRHLCARAQIMISDSQWNFEISKNSQEAKAQILVQT